jgi:thiol-disulfide isomerase/thioredoxin
MKSPSTHQIPGDQRVRIPLGLNIRTVSLLGLILASHFSMAQGGELVKLEHLQQRMQSEKEQIQVVNFWATWCAPCLKELPLFERLNGERKDVKVVLVSMDMDLDPDPEKVRKFVVRKKILSEVLILNERNPNQWIDKLDKNWSGALPATLVLNNKNGKRKFVEKELHEGDLEKLIAEVQ